MNEVHIKNSRKPTANAHAHSVLADKYAHLHVDHIAQGQQALKLADIKKKDPATWTRKDKKEFAKYHTKQAKIHRVMATLPAHAVNRQAHLNRAKLHDRGARFAKHHANHPDDPRVTHDRYSNSKGHTIVPNPDHPVHGRS